ncbi:uncharacterized protein V1516DRAFT_369472 [Lipomyces oligophaga]|uniref:uncharacterized protein n=1 Tax=Lipomyces oligophaga TaxID=45792 RepID=UPI0034CD1478
MYRTLRYLSHRFSSFALGLSGLVDRLCSPLLLLSLALFLPTSKPARSFVSCRDSSPSCFQIPRIWRCVWRSGSDCGLYLYILYFVPVLRFRCIPFSFGSSRGRGLSIFLLQSVSYHILISVLCRHTIDLPLFVFYWS